MTLTNDSQSTTPATRKPFGWKRSAYAFALLGGGFVLGAVSMASAHGGMPWHHPQGPRIGMIQHVVRGALDNVGATTAQEDKIHDIIATTYTDFDSDKAGREAIRKQALDLLRAPTIDRAAVEKLRADQIAKIDAKSKSLVSALLDAIGQLTPDQRDKLVQMAEDPMEHGGWGPPHGSPMDEHGMGNGPQGDHGPNDRPDHH